MWVCKKTKYTTEQFALDDLKRFQEKKPPRPKTPIGVYFCRCGFWHLTSKPNWDVKIAELESTIKTIENEKLLLKQEILLLQQKNKAFDEFIKKAEHKQVSAEPRVIMLNKTIRKAKGLIRKLRKTNSALIIENIHLKKNNHGH